MFSGLCWILYKNQHQCNWCVENREAADMIVPSVHWLHCNHHFPFQNTLFFSRVKFFSEIKCFLLLGTEPFPGTATQNGTKDKYSWNYALFLVINTFTGLILSYFKLTLKWQMSWLTTTPQDARACSTSCWDKCKCTFCFRHFQASPVNS